LLWRKVGRYSPQADGKIEKETDGALLLVCGKTAAKFHVCGSAAFDARGEFPVLSHRMLKIWVAALAAGVAMADEELSWEEARCIMTNKRIAFFGDSVTRFC